jgi:hypothetical protein
MGFAKRSTHPTSYRMPPPPPPPPPAAPPPEVDGPVPLKFVTGKLGFPLAPKACVPVVTVVFPPPGPGVAPAPPGAWSGPDHLSYVASCLWCLWPRLLWADAMEVESANTTAKPRVMSFFMASPSPMLMNDSRKTPWSLPPSLHRTHNMARQPSLRAKLA